MTDYYVGEIRMLAIPNGKPPLDWLLCNGAVVNISQYQALFALIGTAYGGNGVTTFALPDLRGRLPIGQGTGPGLTPRVLSQAIGEENAHVPAATLPAHNHTFYTANVAATASAVSQGGVFANTDTTAVAYMKGGLGTAAGAPAALNIGSLSSVGGGQTHNNIMPCATVNFIICWQGIFPQRAN